MFKINQKIVCIRDFTPAVEYYPNIPIENEIYTIRAFTKCGGIYLKEITNPKSIICGGQEPSFNPICFRPIDGSFGKEICENLEENINIKELELV